MSFLSNVFGYILNFIYNLVQNYGIAIILFSILLKIILLPISIKQQKTMIKTSKIQKEIKKVQEKYKNDQMKMNQEMMDLYKRENMSPLSGCLSTIIQLVLLIAIFGLVRNPLTYMKKIDSGTMDQIKKYVQTEAGENAISKNYPEISIIKNVVKLKNGEFDVVSEETEETSNASEETENIENKETEITLSKDEIIEKGYIDMRFLGLDLSNIPQENLKDPTVYIIPVLYVLTSMLSMKMTTSLAKKKKNDEKEIIVLENENSENEEPKTPDMSEQMNKSMSWFMPIMSVSISIIAPLGLALYWLVNNILMIAERLIVNKFVSSKEETENE